MSRSGCHLCEEAERAVALAIEKGCCPPEMVEVVDVDADLALAQQFGMDVPVVLIDGTVKMKHVIDQTELEGTLLDLMGGESR